MRGRRFILMLALTTLAVVSVSMSFSGADFATTSEVGVVATTDSISDWLSLHSSPTDPFVADRPGYARQHNSPVLPFVARGSDDDLFINWGEYPDTNTTYTFDRSFTLQTPDVFPVAGVRQVTVTAVYWVSEDDEQPIRKLRIAPMGSSKGSGSVTLGPGQRQQVNVDVRARRKWEPGEQFHAHIVLALSYPGGPEGYYEYDIETLITVI